MADTRALRTTVAQTPETHLQKGRRRTGQDPIGQLADILRQHISALMCTNEEMRRWYPAYATLTSGPASTPTDYRSWLQRVAEGEFADELLLGCLARTLRLPFL